MILPVIVAPPKDRISPEGKLSREAFFALEQLHESIAFGEAIKKRREKIEELTWREKQCRECIGRHGDEQYKYNQFHL